MEIRTAIAWILLIFAIGLAFVVFIKPELKPKEVEEVARSELWYVGEGQGEHWYIVLKKEVKDWLGILGQAGYLTLAVAAFLIKGRKLKKV